MKLHQISAEISALAPIDGIDSAGGISFKPEATTEQRAAAQVKMDELLPILELSESFGTLAVGKGQFKIWLHRAGKLVQAKNFIESSDDEEMKIWWSESSFFRLESPYMKSLEDELGIDLEDGLKEAVKIEWLFEIEK